MPIDRREYFKSYHSTPEARARRKILDKNPVRVAAKKAYTKIYMQRPETKERLRLLRERPKIKEYFRNYYREHADELRAYAIAYHKKTYVHHPLARPVWKQQPNNPKGINAKSAEVQYGD